MVADPQSFIPHLKETGLKADIFTFAQKLPATTPKHKYHIEWENFVAIPITTFSDWEKGVESSVRRAVRKAAKAGVVVKLLAATGNSSQRSIDSQSFRDDVMTTRRFGRVSPALDKNVSDLHSGRTPVPILSSRCLGFHFGFSWSHHLLVTVKLTVGLQGFQPKTLFSNYRLVNLRRTALWHKLSHG